MNPNLQSMIAAVPIVGFAIQRALQLLDPWVNQWVTQKLGGANPPKITPDALKAEIMGQLSLLLGVIAACGVRIPIAEELKSASGVGVWITDFLVSAIVFSAGTEGANSIQKFLQNAKDNSKTANSQLVTVTPATATLKVLHSIQLAVTDPTKVTFTVLEGSAGGGVDVAGVYTAPATPGTYHVLVSLISDPSTTSVALITVQV